MEFWILRGGVPYEVPSTGVLILVFFQFSREVSEQWDQVARKQDFWLRTTSNDLKQKNENYEDKYGL